MENNDYDKALNLILGSDKYSKKFFQQYCQDQEKAFNQFCSLGGNTLIEFQSMLKQYEESYRKRKKESTNEPGEKDEKTKDIGNQLEDLVKYLFVNLPAFKIASNIRNNSNEIDDIIALDSIGLKLRSDGVLKIKQDYFIAECKNYRKKVDVTWVGKFYSLLHTNGIKMGIIFSNEGFSGQSEWYDAKGLVRKLYLLDAHNDNIEDSIYILDFNLKHFGRIANGESLWKIVIEQKEKILFGCKSDIEYIQQHPNQKEVKNELENYK